MNKKFTALAAGLLLTCTSVVSVHSQVLTATGDVAYRFSNYPNNAVLATALDDELCLTSSIDSTKWYQLVIRSNPGFLPGDLRETQTKAVVMKKALNQMYVLTQVRNINTGELKLQAAPLPNPQQEGLVGSTPSLNSTLWRIVGAETGTRGMEYTFQNKETGYYLSYNVADVKSFKDPTTAIAPDGFINNDSVYYYNKHKKNPTAPVNAVDQVKWLWYSDTDNGQQPFYSEKIYAYMHSDKSKVIGLALQESIGSNYTGVYDVVPVEVPASAASMMDNVNFLSFMVANAGVKVLNAAEINGMINSDEERAFVDNLRYGEGDSEEKIVPITSFKSKPSIKNVLFNNKFIALNVVGQQYLPLVENQMPSSVNIRGYNIIFTNAKGDSLLAVSQDETYEKGKNPTEHGGLIVGKEKMRVFSHGNVSDITASEARAVWKVTYWPTPDSLVLEPYNASMKGTWDAQNGKLWSETSLATAKNTEATGLFYNTVNAGLAHKDGAAGTNDAGKYTNVPFDKKAGIPVALTVMNIVNGQYDTEDVLTVGQPLNAAISPTMLNYKKGNPTYAIVEPKGEYPFPFITADMGLKIQFGNEPFAYLKRATVPSGLYFLKLYDPSAQTDARTNGAYIVDNMAGYMMYDKQAKDQNFNTMPAAMWVVDQDSCFVGNATPTVKIANREYGNYSPVTEWKYENPFYAFEGQLYQVYNYNKTTKNYELVKNTYRTINRYGTDPYSEPIFGYAIREGSVPVGGLSPLGKIPTPLLLDYYNYFGYPSYNDGVDKYGKFDQSSRFLDAENMPPFVSAFVPDGYEVWSSVEKHGNSPIPRPFMTYQRLHSDEAYTFVPVTDPVAMTSTHGYKSFPLDSLTDATENNFYLKYNKFSNDNLYLSSVNNKLSETTDADSTIFEIGKATIPQEFDPIFKSGTIVDNDFAWNGAKNGANLQNLNRTAYYLKVKDLNLLDNDKLYVAYAKNPTGQDNMWYYTTMKLDSILAGMAAGTTKLAPFYLKADQMHAGVDTSYVLVDVFEMATQPMNIHFEQPFPIGPIGPIEPVEPIGPFTSLRSSMASPYFHITNGWSKANVVDGLGNLRYSDLDENPADRASAFYTMGKKVYQYVDLAKDYSIPANGLIKIYRENGSAKEYLFEDKMDQSGVNATTGQSVKKGLGYLAIEGKGISYNANKGHAALYVDPVYNGIGANMPTYLLCVAPDSVPDGFACETHTHGYWTTKEAAEKADESHYQPYNGYVAARYLVNLQDSAVKVSDNAYMLEKANMFKWQNYTRLAFAEGIHQVDTTGGNAAYGKAKENLYLVKDGHSLADFYTLKNNSFDGGYVPGYVLNQYTKSKVKSFVDSLNTSFHPAISLMKNKNTMVTWSFRKLNENASYGPAASEPFLMESWDGDNDCKAPGLFEGAWVKVQNGVPVVAQINNTSGNHEGDSNLLNEVINQAQIFHFETTTETPTAADAVAVSAVKVIAGEGNVQILNAAGKKVVVSNILGQTVANAVVKSDDATIAAPAGVVVVAIEGAEAVKAIVK